MKFQDIESVFNRAFSLAFSRKKIMIMFPVLLICGVLVVFCRAVSFGANEWVGMSLAFLPVFLCTGLLLAAGVLLTRIYYHEVKQMPYQLRKLLSQSIQTLIGVSYLSLPLVLLYLLLWTLMGVFHLLKEIPAVGDAMGVLLSFGPFLLVLASLVLALASIVILFFVTPHVALKSEVHFHIAEEIFDRIRWNLFANLTLFFIGFLPIMLSTVILTIAAVMTGAHYLSATKAVGVSLEWFFIMIPFTLLLTPFVNFFFNFATESFSLLQKQKRLQSKVETPEEEHCIVP